jgi:hypothetical protein
VKSFTSRLENVLGSYFQVVAAIIVLVLAIDVMVAVRDTSRATASGSDAAALAQNGTPSASPGASGKASARPKASASSLASLPPVDTLATYKPGTYVPGVGTLPYHGVDFKNRIIRLGYYWKGYDAATSGGASSKQLDEAMAFWRFVQWINKHANDSPTRDCTKANSTCFMGFPFNLHGFKLDEKCVRAPGASNWGPCVVQAGEDTNGWATAAIKVRDIASPFAAVSSHGGLSDYGCPILAAAKIFNPVTYNIYDGLTPSTNGYCLPQGFAWERQRAATISYLKGQNATQYCTDPTTHSDCKKRVYGILFAEYQGEHAAVMKFAKELHENGINLGKSQSNGGDSIYSVSTSITQAQQDQALIVAKFRQDGVNTILAPDSGAEITFTHAAEGAAYNPDYYVWPCSGEDAAGQVRLYDAHQWTRAAGLSCYDAHWNLDLTLDDNARQTQWFHQFQEIACPSGSNCDDPPATAPLVYEGLLPVLVGLTRAGPDITMEKFFAGIHGFGQYRYHAIDGRTADAAHFLVTMGSPDGSQIGDVAKVTWNGAELTPGNSTPGAYDYSNVRCTASCKFS